MLITLKNVLVFSDVIQKQKYWMLLTMFVCFGKTCGDLNHKDILICIIFLKLYDMQSVNLIDQSDLNKLSHVRAFKCWLNNKRGNPHLFNSVLWRCRKKQRSTTSKLKNSELLCLGSEIRYFQPMRAFRIFLKDDSLHFTLI